MTACHFTPSQIDEMTMLEANALFKYWLDFPPVHEAIKIAYKLERKKAAASDHPDRLPAKDPNDPSGIGSLIAQFPNGYIPATR